MSTPTEDGQSPTESEGVTSDASEIPEPLADIGVETDPTLDLDTKFELLRNRRRRIVLSYLVEADDRVDMGEMAEHVAAVENETTVQALSSAQRKRAYVGLYQCHLPKLADAGVIDYDGDRGHAEATPTAEDLLQYVDNRDDGPDWARRYQVATVVVVVAFVLGLVASTTVNVPWSGVAALAGVVVGGVAVGHARDEGLGDGD